MVELCAVDKHCYQLTLEHRKAHRYCFVISDHQFATHLYSVDAIWLTTLIIHYGDIVVANVPLLAITVWIRLFGGHHGGYVKHNLRIQETTY